MQNVTIYTDGACHPNPGKGGWGAYLELGDHTKELFGGQSNTTNNQMEMLAAIKALESLETASQVTLYTDSKYLRDGITKWIKGWKRNGWRTRDKADVKNKELWIAIDHLCLQHNVLWKWVKGHNGNPGNEKADELARKGRGGELMPSFELDYEMVKVPKRHFAEVTAFIEQLD